jgi:SAM-dependent methyltransferase
VDIKELQHKWEALGRRDPLWATLTWPYRQDRRWNVDEFFATGVEEVDSLMEYLRSFGGLPDSRKALDFGCGVGRMTQPLASHFEEVWGIDIAPSMIEQARAHNSHGDRCKYRLNEDADLRFLADETFDFVYSGWALRHMSPPLAARFIQELVRVLAPAGILVFHMAAEQTANGPGQTRGSRQSLGRILVAPLVRLRNSLRYRHRVDTYAVPRNKVVALLADGGARILDVQEDAAAGGGWTSFRYCATRP